MGGSVTTYLSSDIAVNKNSSLRRQWVVVNDTSCPIELIGADTYYKMDSSYSLGGYNSSLQEIKN